MLLTFTVAKFRFEKCRTVWSNQNRATQDRVHCKQPLRDAAGVSPQLLHIRFVEMLRGKKKKKLGGWVSLYCFQENMEFFSSQGKSHRELHMLLYRIHPSSPKKRGNEDDTGRESFFFHVGV